MDSVILDHFSTEKDIRELLKITKNILVEEFFIKRQNTLYLLDGRVSVNPTGPLLDERREGFWTRWWKNGKMRSEGFYKDGELNGLVLDYHDNGQKESEIFFGNGKNRSFKHWFMNGQIKSEYEYDEGGEKHGTWSFWYERSGQKSSEKVYHHGELISSIPVGE